jgi:uncharacterized protein involved in type VI secretion and phage assembly
MPPERLHTGQFFIQVSGNDIAPEVMNALDDALVEDDLAQPAMFALRFNDPQLTFIDEGPFRLGAEVRLGAAGADGQRKTILVGEVTALEPEYKQNNMILVVRGYDRSHRLHRGSKTRTFLRQSDDDIVERIARDNGLRPDIEPTRIRHEYVIQNNQTDMAFLRMRAARHGYQAVVDDQTLRFRRMDAAPQIAPARVWGDTLFEFRARLSAVAQPSEVIVRGWDPKAKRAVVGKATRAGRPSQIGDGKTGADAAEQAFGSPATVVVTDRPVRTTEEADRLAQAILDDLTGDYLTAEGRGLGEPDLRAGRSVEIANLGKTLSGRYFVTATRHEYTAREGYMVTFYASGRRPTSLLAAMEVPAIRQPTGGVVVGLVTNINDPDNQGRVRVTFPWLGENHESDWARVVGIGAGAERGLMVLPEVNDEVLVAFEHGDLNRPYVIGGLWNGKDAMPDTPVQGGKVQVRTLKTRAGHHITIHDDDGAGKVEIKIQKHTLVLDDSGAGAVTIESGSELTLKGAGGALKISASGIELESTGMLKVQSQAVMDIGSNAVLNIKGSMVNIN